MFNSLYDKPIYLSKGTLKHIRYSCTSPTGALENVQ